MKQDHCYVTNTTRVNPIAITDLRAYGFMKLYGKLYSANYLIYFEYYVREQLLQFPFM